MLSTNSTKLIYPYNILVFSCVSADSCDKLRAEDCDETHQMFCAGDDGLASRTLAGVRSEQTVLTY